MDVIVGPGYGPAVRVFAAPSTVKLPGAIRVARNDNFHEEKKNREAVGEGLYTLLEAIVDLPSIHSVYLAKEHGILCFAVWRDNGEEWDEPELEDEIRSNISSALEGLNASNGP